MRDINKKKTLKIKKQKEKKKTDGLWTGKKRNRTDKINYRHR